MQENSYLKQRYHAILSYTGLILILVSILMLTPLLVLLFWPEERVYIHGFIIPATVLLLVGVALWRLFRAPQTVTLKVQEGGVIVLLSWATVCLFSTWPFLTVHGLNFTQAMFEAVSGWTTTGLSVVDVTKSTHLILIWRSTMQLAGGAGLAIIMLAALAGPVGASLSVAEGRSEQLAPHVRRSAKLVITIYSGYALAGTLAYWLTGMPFFDAINHAFAAISTGGFSTKPDSIGHWNSVVIEAVTFPLMILGSLNFLTAFLLFHGKLKAVFRNGEVRLTAALVPVGAMVMLLFVSKTFYPTLSKSVRVAFFETITALTTTGFSTVSYVDWNATGYLLLIMLMLIGGGTGSTAGGIKQYRIYLLFKTIQWELVRPLLPRTAVLQNYVWQGEHKDYIDDGRIRQTAAFVFLYLITFLLGATILSFHGYGLKESLFEFGSALGTIGLSIGITSADAPKLVLWTETFGMLLGRLEFFIIILSMMKLMRDFLRR